MMRSLVLLGIGVLLAVVTIGGHAWAEETEIVTTGVGVATARPDYANIVVWVRATEKTATQSTRQAATVYQGLVRQVGPLGVAPSDVITQQFSVAQEWKHDDDGRPKEFVGYTTGHQLRIRVNDREKVGEVIDASIAAGARSIDKIEFASTKADSAQRVALAEAVRDARERAEIMAAAAGGRLGGLIEIITEDAVRARGGELNVDRARGGVNLAAVADVGPTTLVPGALTQRVIVLGRWQLVKGD
jgi:uncharacterized protein YggE